MATVMKLAGLQRSRVPTASRRALSAVPACRPCRAGSRQTLRVTNALSSPSSNPAFRFGKVEDSIYETGRRSGGVMTVDGAVQKTSVLLALSALGAAYTWAQVASGNAAAVVAALNMSKIAGVVALVSAFATMLKPHWAQGTALVYAASKGIALGGISAMLEMRYPGIALNAVLLTFGTAASLLFAYSAKIIRVTDRFRDAVTMVTGGYFFAMISIWLLSMVGVRLPGLFSGSPLGMAITLGATGLAAANLLVDFDNIRRIAASRMPAWFEWYSGFSLMVTLVWMYTEVLRLLMMFAGGRGGDDN